MSKMAIIIQIEITYLKYNTVKFGNILSFTISMFVECCKISFEKKSKLFIIINNTSNNNNKI